MPTGPGERPMRGLGRLMEPHFSPTRLPSAQIVGYALSVGITLLALWLSASAGLRLVPLVVLLLALALVQAGVQLVSFMHVRESRGPAWHLPLLLIAGGVAVATVVFSLWIVAFKSGVS